MDDGEGNVDEHGRHDRLKDRDHDDLFAHALKVFHFEFAAHRERDEAERGVGDDVVGGDILG